MTLVAPLPVRPPGRPRDGQVEAAIIQATIELLDDQGYGRLTLEAVAARAGVGKATIYRRWPGKEQLVIHAVATVTETSPYERLSGRLREDLVVSLDRMLRKHATTAGGRLYRRLIGESPELMAAYRATVIEPRRGRLVGRLQQAVDAGELREDVDLEVLVDALVGPIMHRVMTDSVGRAPGRSYVEGIVDLVLTGALARPGEEIVDGVSYSRRR